MTTPHPVETSAPPVSPRDRAIGMLEGALVGDALALAPHWNYDQAAIARTYGRIETILAPAADGYHPGKTAGDQTHLGDQTLVLVDSLTATGGAFVPEDFARRWRAFWSGSAAYRDHATKETLANLEAGRSPGEAGSESVELAGPARLAPLLVALRKAEQPAQIAAARTQTALTHNSPLALETAEWIVRLARLLAQDLSCAEALRQACAFRYGTLPAADYLRKAEALAAEPTGAAIEELGQSCPIEKALPAVCLLLLQHGDDFRTALIENVMAGGDSAARGLVLGALLGVRLGVNAIPREWRRALRARKEIDSFLAACQLSEAS